MKHSIIPLINRCNQLMTADDARRPRFTPCAPVFRNTTPLPAGKHTQGHSGLHGYGCGYTLFCEFSEFLAIPSEAWSSPCAIQTHQTHTGRVLVLSGRMPNSTSPTVSARVSASHTCIASNCAKRARATLSASDSAASAVPTASAVAPWTRMRAAVSAAATHAFACLYRRHVSGEAGY